MNFARVLSVFVILLGFALLLGTLLGFVYQVPYGNIAVIKVNGLIQSGPGGLIDAVTSSESLVEKLTEVRVNPLIEAVILDINSGGGTPVASAEVVRAIKELGKPSVALIRESGASGAYWVASACDYIVAHEFSFVGSLGARMDYLEYSGLMDDFNVTYINLSYPSNKLSFSPYQELSDDDRVKAEAWLEYMHSYLVNDTASNRGMTVDELLPYADGSIFMGYEAINYGLIDELGGWPEAYNKTIELTNITEPILLRYDEGIRILDLFKGITGSSEFSLRT